MVSESLRHMLGDVFEEDKVVVIECNGQRFAVHGVIDDPDHVIIVAGPAVSPPISEAK